MSADANIGIMDDELYDLCLRKKAGLCALTVLLAATCDLLLSRPREMIGILK